MIAFASQDIQADMDAAERERQEKIERAWEAYHGDLPKPLKVRFYDDNVTPDFAQVVVDLGVSFLFGKDVPFDVADGDAPSLAEQPAETWLDACWAANDKAATLIKLGLNGGVCGHTMIKVRPGNPRTAPYPRLIVLDPASVAVTWEDDDIDDVWKFVQSWRAINKAGKPVTRRQVTQRADNGRAWSIVDEEADADGGKWRTLLTEVWPYPFAPIFHCQNLPNPNTFWGLSDLEAHLVGMQRALNFTLSNLQKTVRLHAHPKPYIAGGNANDVDASPDKITGLPKDATLGYLQAAAFQEPSLALYERIRSAFHEVAKVPEVATGKVENIGQLSGLALQILYGPLLTKTNTKRALYGPMLARLNSALLALGGFGEQTVLNIWPDPLPQNTMEQRQVALLDHQLGVSNDTLMTQLGYDAELEAEKRGGERDAAIEQAQTMFSRGVMTSDRSQPTDQSDPSRAAGA
jgi:hypothetical protein